MARYRKSSHKEKLERIIFATAVLNLIKTVFDFATNIIKKFF